ncbi:MAG: efflux transporter outer membrane subunit [Alphaproteobacteria bacterium]
MTKCNHIVLALCACSALSGCMREDYTTPQIDVMPYDGWVSENVVPGEYSGGGWIKSFDDPKLILLVSQALLHNNNLQSAAADLDKAVAQAKRAGADLMPVLDLNAKIGRNGNSDTSDDAVSQYGVSLDISWEADVWGRIRSGMRASVYDYYAAEGDYVAARQSLIAQTAKAYFLVVETGKQLDLAMVFEKNLLETLDVTESFYQEGLVSLQDVHLVNADIAKAAVSVQNAKSAYLGAMRSLEILLGRYPAANTDIGKEFPVMPALVPVGLPSEILERRPDVRASERRVAAAFNRLEEARAAKLPAISLTGSLGGSSDHLTNLTDPRNVIWNTVGSVLFPIFNAGRLNADIDIQTAEQKFAISKYKETALGAFSEVETFLSNEGLYRVRGGNLEKAYESSKSAEDIADERFKAGEVELLDLLQIKRSTITANIDRVRAQRELLDQRVNLHLSLGGSL